MHYFTSTECNLQTDKKVFHLRSLIEGAIYNTLGSTDMAAQCFEETIARQNGMQEDKHVAALACYELASIHLQKPGVCMLNFSDNISNKSIDDIINVHLKICVSSKCHSKVDKNFKA